MAKTYKLLDHTEQLTINEIRHLYEGYWVYIVKAELGKRGEILRGIPVVIGTMSADGAEDGIYEKYRSEEYEVRYHLNLLPNKGFISALRFVGEAVE